jgi:hypothetical protein
VRLTDRQRERDSTHDIQMDWAKAHPGDLPDDHEEWEASMPEVTSCRGGNTIGQGFFFAPYVPGEARRVTPWFVPGQGFKDKAVPNPKTAVADEDEDGEVGEVYTHTHTPHVVRPTVHHTRSVRHPTHTRRTT